MLTLQPRVRVPSRAREPWRFRAPTHTCYRQQLQPNRPTTTRGRRQRCRRLRRENHRWLRRTTTLHSLPRAKSLPIMRFYRSCHRRRNPRPQAVSQGRAGEAGRRRSRRQPLSLLRFFSSSRVSSLPPPQSTGGSIRDTVSATNHDQRCRRSSHSTTSRATNKITIVDEAGHRCPRRNSLLHRRHQSHSPPSPFEDFFNCQTSPATPNVDVEDENVF
ncbi:hypothetical protein V8G54_015930 [Vigna mungo]|uniref:Uncharacterized protein n=1 Tax=Vigna mungo TaxID=3915 RepID=A0AAQ3NJD2_VIGMU